MGHFQGGSHAKGLQQLLLVEFGPLLHQGTGAERDLFVEPAEGFDFELGRQPVVGDMKVGWGMVSIIHLDNDPVETGDFRHGRGVGRFLGKYPPRFFPSFGCKGHPGRGLNFQAMPRLLRG